MDHPVDIRHRMEIILQCDRALWNAIADLPERDDEVKDALWRLPPSLRHQMDRALAELQDRNHEIDKAVTWLRSKLNEYSHLS